ncbi:cation:proton antiporter [Rhodococcus sp. WMMA185]|uniref:monovalent cation/H+ antiporter complex subunit F n=1 Tax=Rhodococcus sp. WMMA185 TaxID=679318 RepID=UPI0008791E02|nr:monovalent cation/H+ antiporter complex subunit F [Rhodococcus sp. WMMA185]AOW93278.1 cation:proton antiporter [Rhodococcus sp. WMMA185]
MTVVAIISGTILVVAALLTTYRLLDGPNSLDRLVALDTLIALFMGGLAVWAAYTGDSTIVPAIVALSLMGFIGSISVPRFRVRDK